MKILLTAVNSKYIHSNLAVYSLKAYHDAHSDRKDTVELAEYTINQLQEEIIKDIYKKQPDVLAFSCYISPHDLRIKKNSAGYGHMARRTGSELRCKGSS